MIKLEDIQVCQVGQRERCGEPAAGVVAIYQIFEDVNADAGMGSGVLYLCHHHASTPMLDWIDFSELTP